TTGDLDVRQQTVVQFQADTIANYFIALELFNTHKEAADIIDAISASPFDDHAKTEQLKWLLLFQMESADLKLVNHLARISFIGDETCDVITFVCGGLYRLAKDNDAMRKKINAALQTTTFLDFILRYVSFQTDFDLNLEWLLYFDLTQTHETVLRSKLATIALLKWDEEALLKQLEPLAAMPSQAYATFAVNPLLLLTYLYQHYKRGSIDPEIICELNALYYSLPLAKRRTAPFHIDILLYLYVKASQNTAVVQPYLELISERAQRTTSKIQLETDVEALIGAFFLWENGETDAALTRVKNLSINSHDNATYQLMYVVFQLQTDGLSSDQQHVRDMSHH